MCVTCNKSNNQLQHPGLSIFFSLSLPSLLSLHFESIEPLSLHLHNKSMYYISESNAYTFLIPASFHMVCSESVTLLVHICRLDFAIRSILLRTIPLPFKYCFMFCFLPTTVIPFFSSLHSLCKLRILIIEAAAAAEGRQYKTLTVFNPASSS